MSTLPPASNPYTPPNSSLADAVPGDFPIVKPTWKKLLFSSEGRIGRGTYWGVLVLFIAIFLALDVVVLLLSGGMDGPAAPGFTVVLFVFWVLTAYITIVLQIKRWHDRDKSGWWVLIAFVPLIGGLWVLIECGFLRGTIGPNRFGYDPISNR